MKNKLLKKTIFIQEVDIYEVDIVVIVGIFSKKEMFAWLKKNKARNNSSKWILENLENWNDILDKNIGLFCWDNDVKSNVIILKQSEDTWNYWETLMHEIHHFVHNLSKKRMFETEMEAQAYLFDYLFRSIRRKLQGIDKI